MNAKLRTRKKQQASRARAKTGEKRQVEPVKLTAHEIDLMFELKAGGMPYALIAEKFEISKSYAFDILNHRRSADRWRRGRVR